MDMGMRAKSLKSMMRLLTYKAARTGTTILFANHTYDDPGAMYPTLVKSQAGGKGPIYLASVLVQLASRNEKQDSGNEADDMLPEAKKYSGTTLRALTVKNRFVPPFLECEMYLNFKTGLDKYAGLKDVAVNHGVIQQNGSTYTMGEKKLGYYKNWRKDEELWEKEILPKLEEILKDKYCYGS
jgi:RecA/RadA recombinase